MYNTPTVLHNAVYKYCSTTITVIVDSWFIVPKLTTSAQAGSACFFQSLQQLFLRQRPQLGVSSFSTVFTTVFLSSVSVAYLQCLLRYCTCTCINLSSV